MGRNEVSFAPLTPSPCSLFFALARSFIPFAFWKRLLHSLILPRSYSFSWQQSCARKTKNYTIAKPKINLGASLALVRLTCSRLSRLRQMRRRTSMGKNSRESLYYGDANVLLENSNEATSGIQVAYWSRYWWRHFPKSYEFYFLVFRKIIYLLAVLICKILSLPLEIKIPVTHHRVIVSFLIRFSRRLLRVLNWIVTVPVH